MLRQVLNRPYVSRKAKRTPEMERGLEELPRRPDDFGRHRPEAGLPPNDNRNGLAPSIPARSFMSADF